jgi:ketosteroid isomerase-like protein
MSEQQDNIEVIKKGYDAFISGDVETVMALFDDNIEWVQPGNSTISGTYHGKGEVGRYMQLLGEKSPTVKVRQLLADGDTVVALTEVSVGEDRAHDADVFTVKAGKTTRVEVHTDTAMMERVYGTKQHAAH